MNIAVDAREMVGSIAGKGRYVAELVKALGEIDTDNHYFLYTKQPITEKLPKNMEQVTIGGLPGLRQLWLAIDAKRRNAAVLFAPTGYLPVVFSMIPTVATIHDLAIFVTKDAKPALKTYLAETLLMRFAVSKSSHIVAVSESTKRDLVKTFGTTNAKITTTPLGYDQKVYTTKAEGDQKILDEYKIKPGYLLFVGTLEPRKNIVGILNAYNKLPTELQDKHKLVIGGKKGWFYEEIFATVTELGLENNVVFLGRVPDEHLPALYRQAKIFLFPSFYEGFGLPPLEAMGCGTPVIVANNSSLPEVVGEAGSKVDPYNAGSIKEAIVTLLTDKELYNKRKELVVAQAKKFTWQRTAELTLKTFEKVTQ
jgi:glycosyltransferase involved in cell wall biosynthesis